VPQVRFNFTTIGDLQSVEKGTTIDVLGVLKDVEETSQIMSKATSASYDKRELTLVDSSGFSVRLTIWGNAATSFNVNPESVLAFKGVKVSDFGGRSLSLLSSGSMTVDPDIEEAHRLKGWYDAHGRADSYSTHAMSGQLGMASGRSDPFKTILEVNEEHLGSSSEKPDFFSLKGTVVYIKQPNLCYPACPAESCRGKKVIDLSGAGEWHCERCEKTHPKPLWRYILSVNVSDHTGQIWLNCFDEVGRLILGMSADQYAELRENDEKAAGAIVHNVCGSLWNFRCKAKMDTFQDMTR
jgi:replication factor A1